MFTQSHSNQQGFSMLELVVVLGILTVMTSVSLSFMGDKDEKHRYQESIVKLKAVQRNFLSVGEYQGKIVASGFLIDNGLLFYTKPTEAAVSAEKSLAFSVEALLGASVGSESPIPLPMDLELLPFAARSVWVNTGNDNNDDNNGKKVNVAGSQMFKGVRPGLFDLSEYRDSTTVKVLNGKDTVVRVANVRGTIKDAWGETFKQSPLVSADPVTSPVVVTLKVEDRDYKILPSPAREFRFSEDEFLLPVAGLKVTLKNAPDDTTSFKVALVSFNNEVECGLPVLSDGSINGIIDEKGCWHTIKTSAKTATASSVDNMFRLTQTVDPSAVYDDANSSITKIVTVPSLETPQQLSSLTFTDAGDANEWSLSVPVPVPIPMQDIVFTFSGDEEISAGSHLLVVLCENTAAAVWEIYLRDTNGCNVVPEPAPIPAPIPAPSPVFEYFHLLPGVTPSPIVISLPEPSP
jgi:prepilin-type N-terminal cleavage/methylation domain-containing protein